MGTNWKYCLLLFFIKDIFWVTYAETWNIPFNDTNINITCPYNTIFAVESFKLCCENLTTTSPSISDNITSFPSTSFPSTSFPSTSFSSTATSNTTGINFTNATPGTNKINISYTTSSSKILSSHQPVFSSTIPSFTCLPLVNTPSAPNRTCQVDNLMESIVKNCSGKKHCNVTSGVPNCRNNTCYLEVQGKCLYEEHRMEFCKKNVLQGAIIFLHEPSKISNNFTCSCTVTSKDILQIRAVNVMINKTPNVTNFNLELDNVTVTKDELKTFTLLNTTNKNKVNLKLYKETTAPYQVWLKISSAKQFMVNVECKEIRKERPSEKGPQKSAKKQIVGFFTVLQITAGAVGGVLTFFFIIYGFITYKRVTNFFKRKTEKDEKN